MKRSKFLFAGAVLMLLGACQENKVMIDYDSLGESTSAYIEFSDYVSGITRASKGVGASFTVGDAMGVFGYQTMDGNLSPLFNNQLVSNVSTSAEPNLWTYEPKKYWDAGSKYDFYAIYPYSADTYTFDADTRLFNVDNFTVADAADDQIDLMIAQSVIDARPFNKVNFVFNHLLSNVNFYVKTSNEFDVNGISSVTVLSFDITGLYSKGTYAQTSWKESKEPVGVWTADNTSVYDLPEVSNVDYVIGDSRSSLVEDLLLLPQAISDDAMVNVTYKLNYENGDESLFKRSVSLNRILGVKRTAKTDTLTIASWDPNYRYNYIISIDPSVNDNGGHHLPIADPDHDQQDHQDNPYPPTVDIVKVDVDGDGIIDEYWIDEDVDGTPDYIIVWDDIDNDGKEEGMPDRDGDGQPDDSDGDGNPDVIWMDTTDDGLVDTELERDPTPSGPDIPDPSSKTPFADYNGGVDDYMYADSYLMKDDEGEYWIDTDGDGNGDIHILWKNIDDDDLLEGIADKDGDGLLTAADSYDNDGEDYKGNSNDYDVVLYLVEKSDGEMEWKELEREDSSTGGGPDVPDTDVPNTDFDGAVDGYKNPTTYLVKDNDGEYWIDQDGDGQGDIHVVWKDIDDDDMLEGIADKVQDGVATAADSYDNDGVDYKGNPNDYDVVLYQEEENGELVWKELEKEASGPGPDLPDLDPRNADYDGKIDGYRTATAILTNDADGNYWIDINGDDVPDYPVLWKNVDDDDKLEGIVDRNKDGEITPEDNFDGDGLDYKGNPNEYDVVLYQVEENGELVWKELEKDPQSDPDVPVVETSIEFSAEVTNWYDDYDGDITISSNND